ncbi:MAG: HsdR family type I site-specific deoxyribonuclease [Nitrospirae bacterium]|nr:HsdR family type I site-specific deoxyribonuclease [Nitrospirota bacterium]
MSERTEVQDPLIHYATEIGWHYIAQDDALTLRGSETGLFFNDVLAAQLRKLNPRLTFDPQAVIRQLENVRADIEGNYQVLLYLRGQKSIYDSEQKRELNLTLIDFDHPENNLYHVTDEWSYTNGRHTNRADAVFLINGIPIALVETKGAKKSDGIEQGLTQVRRYHRETPELVTAPQVWDVTHFHDFYYGGTWSLDRKNLFKWKDDESFESRVKSFFDRPRLLSLLRDYILFTRKDDELRKFILRQHQTRAVEKVVARALDPQRRSGLIWHTQGSGKTFTLIVAAEKLLAQPHPILGKNTVLMIVDRNELESQLFGNLSAYGFKAVELADSKARLRELLADDYRGLIVSMIHKFDDIAARLNTRANIYVLVDEAHRTTGGDLGNYLMGALPNATYLGFTGTPIDATSYGQGTFKTFGKDDAQGYLDKYSIAESITDGTTLPLHYSLADNDVRVPREQLEKEFLELLETEGISDIDELNKILDRAVTLKTFLKSPDRVGKVAQFVANHYRTNVEPMGYKAFLVGVDREACALYKQALDKYLPSEYSVVVYTAAHNDKELLQQFYVRAQYPFDKTQDAPSSDTDAEKKLRKAFIKKNTLPKILIVTDKLLTGFDAPVLYCMYLDKPMRDHTLLQAIARVNRPYEDEDGLKKPAGFVVDFVGIFEKLEKALAFDSDEVKAVINNLDLLKNTFAAAMRAEAPAYLQLAPWGGDDKTLDAAIAHFADKEKREEFFRFFKRVESLYEIISPDAFLRDFVTDYTRLSDLYAKIHLHFSPRVFADPDLQAKTADLVKQHVTSTGVREPRAVYEINAETLEAIKAGKEPEPVKVFNLIKSLAVTVDTNANEQPYLLSIGERAEAIRTSYDDRQVGTKEALEQAAALIEEYNRIQKERTEKNFDTDTFSVFVVLRQHGLDDPHTPAIEINALFDAHPHWRTNANAQRALKAKLYKALLALFDEDKSFEVAKALLKLERKPVN